ncbi:MAG: hypothetical protein ACTSQJ_00310 [Promethearchaeota archaeon]
MINKKKGYNYIEDIGHAWILWKQGHLNPVGSFYIKNVFVEFGYDPSDNTVKIRRLGYLKEEYPLKKIKEIARMTEHCPFCVKGKPLELINLNTNKIISYINKNYIKKEDSKNMVTMTDWLDDLTKMPEINKNVIPQLFARLLNMGAGLLIDNEIIKRILINLIAGGAGLAANEFLMPDGRLKDELRIFTGNILTSAIPNPNIEKMAEDLATLIRAARFGGPLDILKTAFQSPIERIQEAIRHVTREFALPEFPKLPFGKQVSTAGFKLPEVSPKYTGKEEVVSDVAYLTPGKRVAGFRVTETISR